MNKATLRTVIVLLALTPFFAIWANWQGGHNCKNHWPEATYSFTEGCRIDGEPAHNQGGFSGSH